MRVILLLWVYLIGLIPFILVSGALIIFFIWVLLFLRQKNLNLLKAEPNEKQENEKNNQLLLKISNSVNECKDLNEFLIKNGENLLNFFGSYLVIGALYNNFDNRVEPVFYKTNLTEEDNNLINDRAFALTAFEEAIKLNTTKYFGIEDIENILMVFDIKNKSEKLKEFYAIILKDANNKVIGLLGFAQENGKLKEIIEKSNFELYILPQLSRSMEIKKADDVRKKYEFIVNASAAFMTLINYNYVYEAANNAFIAAHKLKREEVIGKTIADIWGKKDFEAKIKHYFDKALNGETINYQAWLETKKTGLLCYDITYYPYLSETGEYTHVVVVSRDITNLVKAEETVRKLNLAIEQTEEVVIMADIEGKITYVNPAFEKVYGYSREEVLGKNVSIIKAGFYDEDKYAEMWETLLSGKSYKAEMINRLSSGELLEVENSISPFFDSYNNVLGFIAVQRDITARKKAEKALTEAKELAEKSDRLKGEFLAQLSHEIRTPLNSMVNSIQFIKEDLAACMTEDSNELFDSIITSANRIIRTVHMIVNMSEIQTGNYKYTSQFVNVCELAEKVSNQYSKIAKQRGLEFSFTNNLINANIFCDCYSVEQILIQLTDNAVKFTDKGSVELILDRTATNELVIKVRDTGIGISEEYIKEMYRPFSQEQQGYTRRYDGNGLGLALAKKYCEINNAEIFCESKKNLGTEFTVIFYNTKV